MATPGPGGLPVLPAAWSQARLEPTVSCALGKRSAVSTGLFHKWHDSDPGLRFQWGPVSRGHCGHHRGLLHPGGPHHSGGAVPAGAETPREAADRGHLPAQQ
ncbi:protein crumbs homolog 3 isoform X2 [Meriones unguiculatus]|uniref:protein crumbs homolog 3 isoform X2 n=1 Tax=Meriones unguiculatus TaxID=10047 RepID=UPI00293EDA94|nr:protein crumbs homolog 3 isoform X2 [Meriones unguiculatus]